MPHLFVLLHFIFFTAAECRDLSCLVAAGVQAVHRSGYYSTSEATDEMYLREKRCTSLVRVIQTDINVSCFRAISLSHSKQVLKRTIVHFGVVVHYNAN